MCPIHATQVSFGTNSSALSVTTMPSLCPIPATLVSRQLCQPQQCPQCVLSLQHWWVFSFVSHNNALYSPHPYFVRLTKNNAICCSRQILMAPTVLNVGVAIFWLPNTMFMCGIRRLTGIFRLSHVGVRGKIALYASGYALTETPPTPR